MSLKRHVQLTQWPPSARVPHVPTCGGRQQHEFFTCQRAVAAKSTSSSRAHVQWPPRAWVPHVPTCCDRQEHESLTCPRAVAAKSTSSSRAYVRWPPRARVPHVPTCGGRQEHQILTCLRAVAAKSTSNSRAHVRWPPRARVTHVPTCQVVRSAMEFIKQENFMSMLHVIRPLGILNICTECKLYRVTRKKVGKSKLL